jgi:hypothetical protein
LHPLVDAEWLARGSGPGLHVVDARWHLDPARKGCEPWRAGPVPAAAFVDVDRDLSAPFGGRGLLSRRHSCAASARGARSLTADGVPVILPPPVLGRGSDLALPVATGDAPG